jgi:ubiquinone/menaquinone biosynthesis C-methylase UbiE
VSVTKGGSAGAGHRGGGTPIVAATAPAWSCGRTADRHAGPDRIDSLSLTMVVSSSVGEDSVFARGRNRATHTLMAGLDVNEMLDYGCGQAKLAVAAAQELGLAVHACDVDASLIEELSRNGSGVDFFAVAEDRPRLPLADGRISVITCCDVIEHMPPALRSTALSEMRRVLADDGALILTVPHKGLLSVADPENAKFHFPRAHRLLYRLKGSEKYRLRYGGESFGNFSSGAERHLHFSRSELTRILADAGFEVQEVRYYTLIYPLARLALWLAEGLRGKIPGSERLLRLCWSLYNWDANVEPGRLACAIAVRARPMREHPAQ